MTGHGRTKTLCRYVWGDLYVSMQVWMYRQGVKIANEGPAGINDGNSSKGSKVRPDRFKGSGLKTQGTLQGFAGGRTGEPTGLLAPALLVPRA